MEMSMPAQSVNGASIYYECAGHGPPLLLIHGLGSSGDDWAFQRDEFAREYRLILPDLRGSGRSAKPPGPYSIAQFSADLWALLDALGIESTNILGFSLGGAVAQEMALMRPAQVRSMVLCNALANYRTDTWRKWLEARVQVVLVHALGLRRTARLIANRLFPHEDQAPKRQRVIDVVGANPRSAYLATIHALIGWSALERIHAIACPVLILAAEFDYTPLADKRAEAMHFPQVHFVVVEGSRHGTPFDATTAFNACVLEFLAAKSAPHHAIATPV
jgi:pimeloyl-ACP methyl ester carboxylesterase